MQRISLMRRILPAPSSPACLIAQSSRAERPLSAGLDGRCHRAEYHPERHAFRGRGGERSMTAKLLTPC